MPFGGHYTDYLHYISMALLAVVYFQPMKSISVENLYNWSKFKMGWDPAMSLE